MSRRQSSPGITYDHTCQRGDRRRLNNDHVISSKRTCCVEAAADWPSCSPGFDSPKLHLQKSQRVTWYGRAPTGVLPSAHTPGTKPPYPPTVREHDREASARVASRLPADHGVRLRPLPRLIAPPPPGPSGTLRGLAPARPRLRWGPRRHPRAYDFLSRLTGSGASTPQGERIEQDESGSASLAPASVALDLAPIPCTPRLPYEQRSVASATSLTWPTP